jgi:protein-S-isoprenylcysteine O-methyltransferase Ste14
MVALEKQFKLLNQKNNFTNGSYMTFYYNTMYYYTITTSKKRGDSMLFTMVGTLGFIGFLLFDIFSMKQKPILKYSSIVIGMFLIVWSTYQITQLPQSLFVPILTRYIALVLGLVFFGLLIYSVFIEVGIKTYRKVSQHLLVTDGTYSLVRHPGVIWLFLFYFFFALFFMSNDLLITAFVWTFVNTVYIIIQERLILVKLFSDYESYSQTTPMVIPNIRSMRKFMTTMNWRKE